VALPVVEQIAAQVRLRLAATQNTSGAVRPGKIAAFRPRDYQIVVTQEENEPNFELSYPGNPPAQAYDATFLIAGELRPSDYSNEALDKLRNQFHADVVKAITQPALWHNWLGLAVDTRLGTVEPYQDEASSGFQMRLVITYRVSENNPYQVRA